MSRALLFAEICLLVLSCSTTYAEDTPAMRPLEGYEAELLRGAEHACKHPERANKHFANMLQASCVAAAMQANMQRGETLHICYGEGRRSIFLELADLICGNLRI